MTVLLDTHLLLWAAGDPGRLSSKAQNLLGDPATELMFSTASIWEVVIKSALGRDGPTAVTGRTNTIGVRGCPPERFYRLLGRLMDELSHPVNLVDLDFETRVAEFLEQEGQLVRVG